MRRDGCHELVGTFLIPVFLSLAQAWASFRVILLVQTDTIYDGIHYISQARSFQERHVSRYVHLNHLGIRP